MGKLKIGVFGAYRGMYLMEVLALHPDASLVAVCDKYRPALEKTQKMADEKGLKVALYESFDDFIEHDMDAVVLANYANEHAPFAIRLLKSGRHVLSEVLPCETMSQAVELIEAVETSGKVYAYGENYCYMRSPFEMRRRYESGEIGEVQYAEGEYIHDGSSIAPAITYGDRNHWRNRVFSTFYCTHSLGPILTVTGRRPVQVIGFETNPNMQGRLPKQFLGPCNAGLELVTLDNGAIARSLHGGLKREPWSVYYEVYGTKGMMESNRWDLMHMSSYIEGDKVCQGDLKHYPPEPFIAPELAKAITGHAGSDLYPTHFFIEKILGRPDGIKYSIDVYQGVDMGICGLLAYRSVLNGNAPIKVPNLRNKEERDAYRNDHACTNPEIAGDQLLPVSPHYDIDAIPDEAFESVRNLWLEGKGAE